jgi:UDP-N-acetylglucosamine--N-acetylmuramyl-(pentapeptide) pyrophosphoryl-undecaprenol N-acetylglucosamine transferase
MMEPNAIPGLTNRHVGRFATRALLNFPEASKFFPSGKSVITGLPVRPEFFAIRPKTREATITVLITGGSQGSRRLNEAARASWNYFRESKFPIRFIHQTGVNGYEALAKKFAETGLEGELVPFIDDMPAAFARADLVIGRAGAGALAELAAAGKPAILVPLPSATDDHQLRNAEAFTKAGAAQLVLDSQMDGGRLFEEVGRLSSQPAVLKRMGDQARKFAHPEAARQAADLVEASLVH